MNVLEVQKPVGKENVFFKVYIQWGPKKLPKGKRFFETIPNWVETYRQLNMLRPDKILVVRTKTLILIFILVFLEHITFSRRGQRGEFRRVIYTSGNLGFNTNTTLPRLPSPWVHKLCCLRLWVILQIKLGEYRHTVQFLGAAMLKRLDEWVLKFR